ncbi:MAG TPA: DUF2844 domain-containing protein [Candidatus Acidoferrales bacterium]|jgi:hypothetical protein|nr:DUF2844 domain-containing protein [Candidatus Acidoferrales bacterium]
MARTRNSFRTFMVAVICAALAAFARPSSTSASLGGNFTSVEADQAKMQASLKTTSKDLYSIHEIHVPNDVVVREFVSPAGSVFGVAWKGPARPDLRQLLGPYFDAFAKAAQTQKTRRVGRGPLVILQAGLVVEMGGHTRSFFGRAYDPRMVPSGVPTEEIR